MHQCIAVHSCCFVCQCSVCTLTVSSVCISAGVLCPEELTVECAHSTLESMFRTLREVAHARDHLKNFSSVFTPGDGAHQVRKLEITGNSCFQNTQCHIKRVHTKCIFSYGFLILRLYKMYSR